MGGCRCVFRQCQVSSARNPRMHFFHFPVKDQERFMKWVDMAGANQILDLPASQQKNRVICGRHFHDDAFMNYKKDRLVGNAVPTLMRLSDTFALDYSEQDAKGTPQIITLKKSKMYHLIPPPGFPCPLEMDKDVPLTELYPLLNENYSDEQLMEPGEGVDDCVQSIEVNFLKKPKILNVEAPENEDGEIAVQGEASSDMIFKNYDQIFTLQKPYELQRNACNGIQDFDDSIDNVEVYEIANASSSSSGFDLSLLTEEGYGIKRNTTEVMHLKLDSENGTWRDQQDDISVILENEENKPIDTYEGLFALMDQLEADLKAAKQELAANAVKEKAIVSENVLLKRQNEELKSKCEELRNENQSLREERREVLKAKSADAQKHTTVSSIQPQQRGPEAEQCQQMAIVTTSKENVALRSMAGNPTAQALSKAQLFNGIKKYICSTMMALVRMEMFGNQERQWKPDEQRVALDLLRLGEPVYKYFCDEWRFRLPALREVRIWHNEQSSAMEDEEDL